MTVAAAFVVYVIVEVSPTPSPFGLIVAGSAARSVIASGPVATLFPSVPATGVAPATSIRQRSTRGGHERGVPAVVDGRPLARSLIERLAEAVADEHLPGQRR